MSQDVTLTVENKIATIKFNRPEFMNAFSRDSYRLAREYLSECGEDKNVGAVVITGEGKHFSAGGDVKRFKAQIEGGIYLEEINIRMAGAMSAAVRRCPKPTIAMVNGSAAGAGCAVALACDFRVVSPKSRFIMSFIKMGLSGDTGGMYYMQRLLGIAKTSELMMLGTPVGGEEALRLGLATKLADVERLDEETYAFAALLAAAPMAAIRRQKALINEFFYGDIDSFNDNEVKYMIECSHTHDFEEAVNAFLEKRSPSFCGE